MAQPRNHHYVPQGYLKGFTLTPNVLYVHEKEHGGVRQSSPKGVAYAPGLYTVDTIDEKDSAEVEEVLGKIESKVIPILGKLVSDSDLTNAQRADLAIYLALQYRRTPHSRKQMDWVATIITTNVLKEKLADAVNNEAIYQEMVEKIKSENPKVEVPSREELKGWVLKPGPLAEISIDNGTFVKQAFESAELVAQGLLEARWEVIKAPTGSTFITSDNPIALIVERKLAPHEIPAILLPGVKRYFPIDAKHCLLIAERAGSRDITRRQASKTEVRVINRIIHLQALKYTISGNKPLLTRIVKVHDMQ